VAVGDTLNHCVRLIAPDGAVTTLAGNGSAAWGDGTGAAADVFRSIARRIIDDIAPPTNMAGCSARMLGMVDAALAAKDAERAAQSSES
jgi:ATP-binding protein involved in chromosome partitioning